VGSSWIRSGQHRSVLLGEVGKGREALAQRRGPRRRGKQVPVCVGGDHLLEIISMTAPQFAQTDQQRRDILDPSVQCGPLGANASELVRHLRLYCQNAAGNGFGAWGPPWSAGGAQQDELRQRGREAQAGDVGIATGAGNHHGTIIAVDGNTTVSVEGNMGVLSNIVVKTRSMGSGSASSGPDKGK